MAAEHDRPCGSHRSLSGLPDEILRELADAARLASLGELTAGIAHELNNPLFAVLGLAELSLADAEPGSPVTERLELVRSTALEMRDTIRTLVDFARPPEGDADRAELTGAAHAAVELFRRTSIARRLDLSERHPDETIPVAGDEAGLRQIVLELLLAARRSVGDTGSIAVESSRSGGEALLRVRDDGAGDRREGKLGFLVARVLAADRGGSIELEAPGVMLLRLPAG